MIEWVVRETKKIALMLMGVAYWRGLS